MCIQALRRGSDFFTSPLDSLKTPVNFVNFSNNRSPISVQNQQTAVKNNQKFNISNTKSPQNHSLLFSLLSQET